jgi:CheY-like chemotaxis protein/HPt (histidine-containing phosphotransfer) domain-containing protein
MKTYNPKNFIVLVVDDITENLQVLISILKKHQYKINFANSGNQAINRIKNVKPDLILLDLMMPDMDGFQVCEYLKSEENYRDIPIIFLTASHEEHHILKAFEIGAVDYVTKPFKSQELLARVKNHLELKHAKDKLKNSQNYLKKALTELVIARDKALEAERVKSQMLANTSHEIRTLMSGVLGMTELLLNTYLNEEQNDFVTTLKNSGESLLNLINDILDFSKLESGALKLKKTSFNLHKMMENLQSLFSHRANQKNLNFSYHITSDIPQDILLIGDEFRLRQILSNLISNAIKFTDQGKIEIKIKKLEADENDNSPSSVNLLFEVKDTGIGISEKNQAQLFKSFCQISHNNEHYYDGTGLGLAICQQLVQLMGANILVESKEGKGSNFFFKVNFDIGDQSFSMDEIGVKYNLDHTNNDHITKNSHYLSMALKILLVEDTPVNKKVIMNQLKILNYEADWVENGQDAIKQLADNEYDLILMDCQMPILNGYEATKQIRQRETDTKGKHIIIIGLTASAMEGNRQQCFDAGMDDYITKPASTDELDQLLKKWAVAIAQRHFVIANSQNNTEENLPLDSFSIKKLKHIKYPVDMERLYKFTAGDLEFQNELLLCFVNDTAIHLKEAKTALENQDIMELLFKIHKIKGASGHVGVNLIMDITRNIEQQALANNLEAIPPKLIKIEQILQEVETFISNFFPESFVLNKT